MKTRHTLLAALTVSAAALALTACGATGAAPDTSTESAGEAVIEAEPAALTIDHAPKGAHGYEVNVSFNLRDDAESAQTRADTTNALAAAVDHHPEFDLIVINGWAETELTVSPEPVTAVSAWYEPVDITQIDLENPATANPFDSCYSCYLNGSNPEGASNPHRILDK